MYTLFDYNNKLRLLISSLIQAANNIVNQETPDYTPVSQWWCIKVIHQTIPLYGTLLLPKAVSRMKVIIECWNYMCIL